MKIQNTLFKFRDWKEEYHKKAITENEIYFGSNFSLNDPFDLQLPLILSGNRPIMTEENLRKEYFKAKGKTLEAKELNILKITQKKNRGFPKVYEEK